MHFERREIALPDGNLSALLAGEGRPLVYIGSRQTERVGEVMAELAKKRQVYVPLIPSFAAKTADGAKTPSQYADLIASLIAEEVGQPCDVVGNSVGCAVAALLAARYPEKVDHLVLQSPIINAPAGPGVTKQAPTDLEAALAHIEAVTLILCGSRDQELPPTYMHDLKAAIRKSYLIYVYDAGHDIEADQPRRLRQVLSDFLEWGEGFLVNRRDQRVSVWPRAEQVGHA